MATTTARGKEAEDRACQFLLAQGLHVLFRNYRLRGGEIDLVCRDTSHLVFVEVRYRANDRFGGAIHSIDWRKQERIIRTARHYMLVHHVDMPVRFDVIAMTGKDDIQWIKHAFEAE